jgi:hypothetical protein
MRWRSKRDGKDLSKEGVISEVPSPVITVAPLSNFFPFLFLTWYSPLLRLVSGPPWSISVDEVIWHVCFVRVVVVLGVVILVPDNSMFLMRICMPILEDPTLCALWFKAQWTSVFKDIVFSCVKQVNRHSSQLCWSFHVGLRMLLS